MDFAQILLANVWGCHPYSSREKPVCQFPILISKTVKKYDGYEIALYMLANKLVCHTFMDILKKGVSWVRNKTSLLFTAEAVAQMTVLFCILRPHFPQNEVA